MSHHLPHGGWCPKGRLAEDGVIDARYPLQETPSASYAERTEWNIRDADATVLFSLREQVIGGSLLTANLARRSKKPFLHLVRGQDAAENVRRLKSFLARHKVQVLNVAGPRASEEPQVGQFVQQMLQQALGDCVNQQPASIALPAVRRKPEARKAAAVPRRSAA